MVHEGTIRVTLGAANAREAASARAAVSRQLAILADDGVVSLQRGGVIIRDPRRLEWLARNSD